MEWPDTDDAKYDASTTFNPWSINLSEEEIIEIFKKERRIVLTKKKGLFESKAVNRGLLLPPGTPHELVRKVMRELGKGAMGTVYLGKDPKINREAPKPKDAD